MNSCDKCTEWRKKTNYVYCPEHDVIDSRSDEATPDLEEYKRKNKQKRIL